MVYEFTSGHSTQCFVLVYCFPGEVLAIEVSNSKILALKTHEQKIFGVEEVVRFR